MQTPTCWHWGLYFWDKNTFFSNNFLPSKSLICLEQSQTCIHSLKWSKLSMDKTVPLLRREPCKCRSQILPKAQLVRAAPAEPNHSAQKPRSHVPIRMIRLPPTGTHSLHRGGDLLQTLTSVVWQLLQPKPIQLLLSMNHLTLSLTQFKCSCKTRSLLILGTAEERCRKQSCQSVQRNSRRWREKKKKVQWHRWQGRKRWEGGKEKK